MSPDLELGPPVADAVEVAVGDPAGAHAGCYRTRAGEVRCWGGSNLLLNFVDPQPGPWPVPLPRPAVSVVAWGQGHCAVLDDATARCWRGFSGRAEPVDPGFTEVLALAGGGDHLCALRRDGSVWCSGGNTNGQLGVPPGPARGPTRVPEVPPLRSITAGAQGTCGLAREGEAWCWGTTPASPPTRTPEERLAAVRPLPVPALRGARELAFGYNSLFVVDRDGVLGQVGAGGTARPVAGAPRGAGGLAAGGDWACVVDGGAAWCGGWGPVPTVTQAADRAGLEARARRAWRVGGVDGVVDLAVWIGHACAVTAEGAVGCWGRNGYGELGDGTVEDRWDRAGRVRVVRRLRVPAPPEGIYGCASTDTGRAACAELGMECRAAAPPGYWDLPPSGVDVSNDPHHAEDLRRQLEARPVPGCMCTCSEAYREAERALQERREREGPVP